MDCEPDSTVFIEEVETSTPSPLEEARARLVEYEEMAEEILFLATTERDSLVNDIVEAKTQASAVTTQLRILKERHLQAIRDKRTLQDEYTNEVATYNTVTSLYNTEVTWKPPSQSFSPEDIEDLKDRVLRLREDVELRKNQLDETSRH